MEPAVGGYGDFDLMVIGGMFVLVSIIECCERGGSGWWLGVSCLWWCWPLNSLSC